jgi:TonB family protein
MIVAMKQLEFISKDQMSRNRALHIRAFIASFLFHAVLLGLLVGLTFIYWSRLYPSKSGSPQGGQSISLPILVIVPSPPEIPHPSQTSDQEKFLPSPIAAMKSSAAVPAKLPTPEESVPVLTPQPIQTARAKSSPAVVQTHPAISHSSTAAKIKPARAKSVTSAAASYAPGSSVLPHPPYPPEARDLRQTGTVMVSVEFDEQGSVIQARVLQSSGVPVLDSSTRLFIRDHWHSLAYAGQTVNVPIRYTLENL